MNHLNHLRSIVRLSTVGQALSQTLAIPYSKPTRKCQLSPILHDGSNDEQKFADTVADCLPDLRDTDHDRWLALLEIALAVAYRRVGECANAAVPDLQADVRQSEFDDVLDTREGEEGEECVLLGCEDVPHERLDCTHCGDEVCLSEHDALGCAGCARGVHNARDVLCLWTASFMLWLTLAELVQLVLREHLDFAVRTGCLNWSSRRGLGVACLGRTRSTTRRRSALVKTPTQLAGLIERMGETRFAEGVICSCDGDPYKHTGVLHELP